MPRRTAVALTNALVAGLLPVGIALAAVFGAALSAHAQAAIAAPVLFAAPFQPGEKLTYAVKVGPFGHGTATMHLMPVDTVRGRNAYHSTFELKGGVLFLKISDYYESWFDVQTYASLRYRQDIDQGSYERHRTFEIFPDRQVFRENDKPEQPSVAQPLDDGSFLYFMRVFPFEMGKSYEWNRYFKPDRNPVRVTVARRERITVPAGTFDAIVLQPKIKAKGIFAEAANAEVWIADDAARTMLQMRTHLPYGTVLFQLKKIEH